MNFEKNKLIRLCIVFIAAEAINFICAFLFCKFGHIPLFLDTIGTVAAVFYAGFWPGVIVAALYNVLWVLLTVVFAKAPFYPWDMIYALCGIAIAVTTWLFARKKENFQMSRVITVLYLVLIALVSAFASSLIGGIIETVNRIHLGNPVYDSSVLDNFLKAFLGENIGTLVSCIVVRIPITVLDRLICTFAGFALYRLLPSAKEEYDA